jgi:hypothetical protein
VSDGKATAVDCFQETGELYPGESEDIVARGDLEVGWPWFRPKWGKCCLSCNAGYVETIQVRWRFGQRAVGVPIAVCESCRTISVFGRPGCAGRNLAAGAARNDRKWRAWLSGYWNVAMAA